MRETGGGGRESVREHRREHLGAVSGHCLEMGPCGKLVDCRYMMSREGHREVGIAQATQGSLATVCDRGMSGAVK